MTTITLPSEIEVPLAEAARKQGTTAELLALDCLRRAFVAPNGPPDTGETLFEFLSGYVAAVEGTTEALSERCGERFAEGLAQRRHA